ncbi:MAG: hypothetical protein OCD01_11785 [Fibrobacterales bacterium]
MKKITLRNTILVLGIIFQCVSASEVSAPCREHDALILIPSASVNCGLSVAIQTYSGYLHVVSVDYGGKVSYLLGTQKLSLSDDALTFFGVKTLVYRSMDSRTLISLLGTYSLDVGDEYYRRISVLSTEEAYNWDYDRFGVGVLGSFMITPEGVLNTDLSFSYLKYGYVWNGAVGFSKRMTDHLSMVIELNGSFGESELYDEELGHLTSHEIDQGSGVSPGDPTPGFENNTSTPLRDRNEARYPRPMSVTPVLGLQYQNSGFFVDGGVRLFLGTLNKEKHTVEYPLFPYVGIGYTFSLVEQLNDEGSVKEPQSDICFGVSTDISMVSEYSTEREPSVSFESDFTTSMGVGMFTRYSIDAITFELGIEYRYRSITNNLTLDNASSFTPLYYEVLNIDQHLLGIPFTVEHPVLSTAFVQAGGFISVPLHSEVYSGEKQASEGLSDSKVSIQSYSYGLIMGAGAVVTPSVQLLYRYKRGLRPLSDTVLLRGDYVDNAELGKLFVKEYSLSVRYLF